MTDVIPGHDRLRRDPIRWLIVCGTLLILAIVGATAIMVSHFRERALDGSKRQLESTVLLLAEHFDQQLRDLTAIQDDVVSNMESTGIDSAEHYVRRMSSPDIHLMLKTRIGALSYVGSVNLFDPDGTLINSSIAWPIPDVNVGDRKFFKTFKSDSQSPSTLVELVRSRVSGARTTALVRKLTGRNGEFMGVIGRDVDVAHYEKFFASVALGKDTAITMFHRDGTMLARHPSLDSIVGRNFSHGVMFQYVLSHNGNATGLFKSPINGEERLGSARALQNFPMFVMVTTTVAAALADWRQQMYFLVGAAFLSTLAIAATLFLIVRQLSLQHRLERDRLDTAVNNMRQGLLLFDSSQRLVVCNERYIEMFGLSRDVVKPGCSLRDLVSHRKETGSLREGVDEHCALVLRNAALNNVIVTETTDGRLIQTAYRSVAGGGWVTTLEDITERQRAEDRVAHLAHYDSLTDLPNRVLFRERLEQELRAIEHGNRFAVILVDIDEFKGINDSLGHAVGDELLKQIAARLRECVDSDVFIARLGGDEFAVLKPLVLDAAEVTELLTGIHTAIREPHACLGHQISIDASIGIAMAPKDGCQLDELLKNADLAMYDAKNAGRHTWRFFAPDMDKRAKSRRVMEEEIRQIVAEGAFAEGGFEVRYQPLVSLQSGDVTGCEALLRWRHPERGMISPVDFIPLAEDTGLIDQLGEWVLIAACTEAASWPDRIKVAVNVSPVQFRRQTFPLKVAAALAKSNFPAGRLELELTEAVFIRDDAAALATLQQLRSLGVRIALDDFGTGYSSLSYLQRFPFDKIKIDQSFVKDIVTSQIPVSIVEAVVNIARARNITTTVEGVETVEQRDRLRELGCGEMQGYLFSPARPAADIRKLLVTHRAERAIA